MVVVVVVQDSGHKSLEWNPETPESCSEVPSTARGPDEP